MKIKLLFLFILSVSYLTLNAQTGAGGKAGELKKIYRNTNKTSVHYHGRDIPIFADCSNPDEDCDNNTAGATELDGSNAYRFFTEPLFEPKFQRGVPEYTTRQSNDLYELTIPIYLINQDLKNLMNNTLMRDIYAGRSDVRINNANIRVAPIDQININEISGEDDIDFDYKQVYQPAVGDNNFILELNFFSSQDRQDYINNYLSDMKIDITYIYNIAIEETSRCKVKYSDFSETKVANTLNGNGAPKYVSRTQIKNLSSQSFSNIAVACINDGLVSSPNSSDDFIFKTLEHIINNSEQRKISLDEIFQDDVYNKNDLSPELVNRVIDDKTMQKYIKKYDGETKNQATTAAVGFKLFGAKGGHAYSRTSENLTEGFHVTDFDYEKQGANWIPKKLNVYEVGNNLFTSQAAISIDQSVFNYSDKTIRSEINFGSIRFNINQQDKANQNIADQYSQRLNALENRVINSNGEGNLKVITGETTMQDWQDYTNYGIYVDIDISRYEFSETPKIFTVLECNRAGWATTGSSVVYNASANNFKVYIRPWYKFNRSKNNIELFKLNKKYLTDKNWKWKISWVVIGKTS